MIGPQRGRRRCTASKHCRSGRRRRFQGQGGFATRTDAREDGRLGSVVRANTNREGARGVGKGRRPYLPTLRCRSSRRTPVLVKPARVCPKLESTSDTLQPHPKKQKPRLAKRVSRVPFEQRN